MSNAVQSILEPLYNDLMWADRKAFTEVESAALSSVSPAAGSSEASSDAERAVAIYAHIVAAEHAWFTRIAGEEPRYSLWPTITLAEARRLADENGERYRALIAGLSSADSDRIVLYRNTKGQEFSSRLVDILTHVALHGSYYRGRLALLVRQCGGTPGLTDYIAFIREMQISSSRNTPSNVQ